MEKHKRTHKWAFPLGMLLVLLAVVGLASLGKLAADGIQQKLNNPEDRLKYEEFLSNIIVHDPDPFDSVDRVPLQNIPQLLDICIWAITQSDEQTPLEIPMDDEGYLMIPQQMVEEKYDEFFGAKPPSHMDVEGSEFDFIYDPIDKCYRVPVTGSLEIYAPSVVEIKKTGSAAELTVGYLAYEDFKLDERGRRLEPDPAKYMIITIYETEDGKMQVGSIRQPTSPSFIAGSTHIGN